MSGLGRPFVGAERRARSLDALASGDNLMRFVGSTICERHTVHKTAEPPTYLPIMLPMLNYYTRKRALLRADYFRQRFGRPFYAPENRP